MSQALKMSLTQPASEAKRTLKESLASPIQLGVPEVIFSRSGLYYPFQRSREPDAWVG